MNIKLIVAGSRNFTDYPLLQKTLEAYLLLHKEEDIEIVSGTCRGADLLGEYFAKENNLNIKRFPANWDMYGKSAGFIRNKEMGQYSDYAIIFCVDNSQGSINMFNIMTKLNKRDLLVNIYRKTGGYTCYNNGVEN